MLLVSQTMGCGRSKQQSPKNGEPDLGINGTKEKGAGKKKKSKDESFLWSFLMEEKSGAIDNPWIGVLGGLPALAPSGPIQDSGDKKENKDPQKANEKSADTKTSTSNKSNNSLLKPPPTTVNGSSQQTLSIDVEYPSYKDKGEKAVAGKAKDGKEFSGKQTNIKVTNSQIEFFKMLDEKIEQGQDYSDYRSDDSIEISTP